MKISWSVKTQLKKIPLLFYTVFQKVKSLRNRRLNLIRLRPEVVKESTFNKRNRIWIAGAVIIIMLIAISSLIINYRSKSRWAKEIALPKIEQLVNEMNFSEAFQLVQKSRKYLQSDPKFNELATLVTTKLTILTDPPGADVYIREYSDLKWSMEKDRKNSNPKYDTAWILFLSAEIYQTGIYGCRCNSCH